MCGALQGRSVRFFRASRLPEGLRPLQAHLPPARSHLGRHSRARRDVAAGARRRTQPIAARCILARGAKEDGQPGHASRQAGAQPGSLSAMLEVLILAAVAAAGFADAPWWSALIGAGAGTLKACCRTIELRRHHPRVAVSTKMTS